MWIDVGTLAARVTRATDEEKSWLSEYLSFRDDSLRFSSGGATDRVRMFNAFSNSFPAGFVQLVKKGAANAGFTVETFDRRKRPSVHPDPQADLAWLRWYQKEAVAKIVAKERGIVKVPTGGGKTEIMVGATRALPIKWLFLVHRKDLVAGAADRFDLRNQQHGHDFGPAGRIVEGKWSVGERLTCASFHTIAAGLKAGDSRVFDLLAEAEGVFVDECHTLPANTFTAVVNAAANAYYRIGLSGTPLERTDQRSLMAIAALGSIVYQIPTQLLVEEGVLAKASITLIDCPQRSEADTWQRVYSEAVVRSERRNRVLVEACKRADPPALLFVKDVAHGKSLVKMLTREGIRAEFVWGKSDLAWRQRKVRDLVQGRVDVLVCSVIFQEGIDIPELRSVVIGSGGKSVIAALQRIGRGMRVEKDAAGNVVKDTFKVFDVNDRGCGCVAAAKALGTPGQGTHRGCKWLDKHARERRQAYAAEGHSTVVEAWVDPLVEAVRGARAR